MESSYRKYYMVPVIRAGFSLLALSLAGLTGPGCLRFECSTTDITCQPASLVGLYQYLTRPLPTTGRVSSFQKISSTQGFFAGPLADSDNFGEPAPIQDLNGDGVTDLVVGAHEDDDGGTGRGAAYVLFMNPNGSVQAQQKISSTQGGLTPLVDDDRFGIGVVSPGDLDQDGVADLVIGADRDDDGGANRGALYVLFMNASGTVKAPQKISNTQGGFTGPLADNDSFGIRITAPGDIDGDGVPDLAIGATADDDGGANRGAVYILFMNANGTVKAEQKISSTQGGLIGPLTDADRFGRVGAPGDLDGDGVPDLAVGAGGDDDGGTDRGAAYILFLNANGTVKAEQKISSTQGGLIGPLDDTDEFGRYLTGAGDLNLDGVPDIVVGASQDDDGGAGATANRGAVYVLFLNANGTVQSEQKISDTEGGFTGVLEDSDVFLRVAAPGDLNGDRVPDLLVGATGDDDGGTDRGAVWVLFLESR